MILEGGGLKRDSVYKIGHDAEMPKNYTKVKLFIFSL